MRQVEPDADLTPAELRDLLERLEGFETDEPRSSYATIEAVCEATGESFDRVVAVLEAIRREDLAARVSERMRELEEPLYRVERPGIEPRVSCVQSYLARQKTLDTILESVPQLDLKRTPRGSTRPKRAEAGPIEWASAFLVVTFALLATGLGVAVLLVATHG